MKIKKVFKVLLILGIVTLPCSQVLASQGDHNAYNVSIYSGVTAQLGSGYNYSGHADVSYNSGNIDYVNVNTESYSGYAISSNAQLNQGQQSRIYGASQYPGQDIFGTAVRYGINGSYYISGNFYPDGN